jgi:hypothetical protein
MTAILWFLASFFAGGGILMVIEIRRAPEGVEDESGFRVVHEAPLPKKPARGPTVRRGTGPAIHA